MCTHWTGLQANSYLGPTVILGTRQTRDAQSTPYSSAAAQPRGRRQLFASCDRDPQETPGTSRAATFIIPTNPLPAMPHLCRTWVGSLVTSPWTCSRRSAQAVPSSPMVLCGARASMVRPWHIHHHVACCNARPSPAQLLQQGEPCRQSVGRRASAARPINGCCHTTSQANHLP